MDNAEQVHGELRHLQKSPNAVKSNSRKVLYETSHFFWGTRDIQIQGYE